MIEIGPNLMTAIEAIVVCLAVVAFCRYVIGSKG